MAPATVINTIRGGEMKGAANACGDMCLSGGPGHSSITTHSKQITHGIINTMWWCAEKIFSWFWTVPHTVQYLSHLYSAQVVMIRFMTQLYCLQCVQYFWRFWWDIGHIYVLFCNWTIYHFVGLRIRILRWIPNWIRKYFPLLFIITT